MKSASSQKLGNTLLVNGILGLIVLLWLIPVIGVFASSFRDRFDIQTTPWWNVLPHRDWVATKTINPADRPELLTEIVRLRREAGVVISSIRCEQLR